MTRLRRSRRGKTAIDVTATRQNGLPRVRVSMGEVGSPNHKNSDLDATEVEELIVLLQYRLLVINGAVEWDES